MNGQLIEQFSDKLKKLLKSNNTETYNGIERYEEDIEDILCKGAQPIIKSVFEDAFRNKFRDISNIHMPLIVFYLHSGITKSRISIPFFFPSSHNNEYNSYFMEYKLQLKDFTKKTKGVKGVLDTEKKDHMLGVMLDEEFHTVNIPLVIRVYKSLSLRKTGESSLKYIDIRYSSNIDQEYNYKGLSSRFKKFGITNILSKNIKRILRRPLEFLCKDRWGFPKSWKTVYYVYFPERILCSSSSGCTVVLVSSKEEKNTDEILKAIDNFVGKARIEITNNVTSIISRLELEAVTQSISSKIEYPKYYAFQKPENPFPQMPLLDRLKKMKEKNEVISVVSDYKSNNSNCLQSSCCLEL